MDVIEIKINGNATLRIRKDKIVATVNIPGSNHIDIYTEGNVNPWHITDTPADAIAGLIWGDN